MGSFDGSRSTFTWTSGTHQIACNVTLGILWSATTLYGASNVRFALLPADRKRHTWEAAGGAALCWTANFLMAASLEVTPPGTGRATPLFTALTEDPHESPCSN